MGSQPVILHKCIYQKLYRRYIKIINFFIRHTEFNWLITQIKSYVFKINLFLNLTEYKFSVFLSDNTKLLTLLV